ncbi:MAG: sigma-70 family RNA polymerase sigma factor [Treponema sp.]|jgi:RNA polymerase sigma factor (sigma-70 family)|nr:sigma-70 family RNA polymerase sigma factor [Treponema sp.]
MTKSSVAEVFNTYRHRLLKFIRSRTRFIEDAEDILQDVFYQFAQANELARPIEQTAAWLYRAARNRIIDKSRKKQDEPLPMVDDEKSGEYIFEEIADIIYGEDATPETEYLRSLILDEIKSALEELPEDQRVVFELTEIAGFSVKEVAEKTAVPVNTVLSRKHYAVKRLRKQLAELYSDVVGER